MTLKPSAMVERDRRERYERGKAKIRPNGGEFVTTHKYGPVGEAYEEMLDGLNYMDSATGRAGIMVAAKAHIEAAAELLAAEIMEREAQ